MSWMDPVMRVLGYERREITHPVDLEVAFGAANASEPGAPPVNSLTVLQLASVYACVKVISETLASSPLQCFRKNPQGGRERMLPGGVFALADTLAKPNEWQTQFEFVEYLTRCLLLRGNGYAFMNWTTNPVSGKEFLAELLPLHPDQVEMRVDPNYRISYKVQLDPAKPESYTVIPRDAMFHLRGPSRNGLMGGSVLSEAREVFTFALQLQQHGTRVFRQGTMISGVLEHPGKLHEETAKRIRESWQNIYSGSANAGKTAVLEEGMKFHEISMTPEDSQFLELRKFSRSEIASLFRVPPHKIGDLERATFSNIEHQSIEFVTDCILPWARRWEQAITRDMIKAEGAYYTEFNLEGLLRGDVKSRYDAYAIGRQWGWLSADDVREKENMNPLPDEQGQIYLVPINMAPADMLEDMHDPANKPAPAAPPVAADTEEEGEDD